MPTDIEKDIIHHDTRQQIELSKRMFAAWEAAKSNKLENAYASPGDTVTYHRGNGQKYEYVWQALESGTELEDIRYSRLGGLER